MAPMVAENLPAAQSSSPSAAGVAAARAVEAGHEVVGVHLALSRMPGTLRTGSRGCCTIEDSMDAQRASNKLLFLEQSISSLLMTLLQDQTLANVKDQYLVQYVDTPFVPESRSYPQRTKLVITSTIIFSILFIFVITFKRFVLNAENY